MENIAASFGRIIINDPYEIQSLLVCVGSSIFVTRRHDNCDAHQILLFLLCDESSILVEPGVVSLLSQFFKTILTMKLTRARRVTLQSCILCNPENSVILLHANLSFERQWILWKTRHYLSHRALQTLIFQQKLKVSACNV